MPMYATVGGVQREITSLPVAVDGVSRKMSSMLGTVDGVQREVFSGTIVYTWKKCEVSKFFVSSDETVKVRIYTTEEVSVYSDGSPSSRLTTVYVRDLLAGDYFIYNDQIYLAKNDFSNAYVIPGYDCYTVTIGSGKGDYIETVTSNLADVYPINGLHTDGYWYVKVDGGESVQTVTVYSNDEAGYWSAVFTQKGSLTVGGVVITSEQQTVTVSGPSVEIIYTVISAMSTARKLYVNGVYVGTTGSSGTTLQTVIEVPESREITITTKNAG